jgi:hypothetical protein
MSTTLSREESRHRKLAYFLFAAGLALLALAYLVGISDNPPGICSFLAGLFGLVLAILYRFGKPGGHGTALQLLYWAPRALCVVVAVFISIFALDVFGKGLGFGQTLLALLMHLVPTFLILIVLAISWRREWIAGFIFLALAVVYAVFSWNKPFGPTAIPLISGPLALTGALFLVNWYRRGAIR